MNPAIDFFAGITATYLMTGFVNAIFLAKKIGCRLQSLLGVLICMRVSPAGDLHETEVSLIAGTTVHYTIGVLFAFVYNWLWLQEIGSSFVSLYISEL